MTEQAKMAECMRQRGRIYMYEKASKDGFMGAQASMLHRHEQENSLNVVLHMARRSWGFSTLCNKTVWTLGSITIKAP